MKAKTEILSRTPERVRVRFTLTDDAGVEHVRVVDLDTDSFNTPHGNLTPWTRKEEPE